MRRVSRACVRALDALSPATLRQALAAHAQGAAARPPPCADGPDSVSAQIAALVDDLADEPDDQKTSMALLITTIAM